VTNGVQISYPLLILGVIIGGFLALLPFSIVMIESTEVGVLITFGKVSTDELEAGIHFIIPFIQKVKKIPIHQKTIEMTKANKNPITALTLDGLPVTIDLAIQYKILPSQASEIYITLKDYESWMNARARGIVRDIISKYKVESLYGSEREAIRQDITNTLSKEFESLGIEITGVFIRNVDLPDTVVQAIENKIQAMQEAERMKYVLEKEQREKERKIIEAEGIAEANRIIAQSLTPEYLQWYWLQTLSEHESVIYVPINQQAFPLFTIPLEGG